MKFSEEDLDYCWPAYKSYFISILNGEYSVEEAREDLASLVGSEYDPRVEENATTQKTTPLETGGKTE